MCIKGGKNTIRKKGPSPPDQKFCPRGGAADLFWTPILSQIRSILGQKMVGFSKCVLDGSLYNVYHDPLLGRRFWTSFLTPPGGSPSRGGSISVHFDPFSVLFGGSIFCRMSIFWQNPIFGPFGPFWGLFWPKMA